MEFWEHLKANAAFDVGALTAGLASRFSELLARGHSVADLLAHYGDEFGHLPVETLRNMAHGLRRYMVWRRRRQQIEEARLKAGLPPVPEAIFGRATSPDQLDAIVRTARLCPLSEVAGEEEWMQVLDAGVDLWRRCLAVTRKQGSVRCTAKDLERTDALAEYDDYVSRTDEISGIAPHRWLAMRRGERAGVLELAVALPTEALLDEVRALQPRLGPPAAAREAEVLLRELILVDMQAWLVRLLDSEAQDRAIRTATEALTGLLRSPPLQVRQVASVYGTQAGAPVAVVVVDREGDPASQRVVRADGAWQDRVFEFIEENEVQHVVVPTTTVGPDLLAALEARLAAEKYSVIKVRPAALAEARRPLTDPPLRLGASTASAVVLARRAFDPLKEWSAVDPVAIGVAEYQNDLDAEMLRAALRETAELCRLERRRGRKVHMGPNAPRANAAMAKLNPLVKSMTDLKPGMTVHGVITNVSHFGAFVNIGLPQEALVHISELADSFVSNPNEVVSIGQQVEAHVLAVEPTRGRISLSLKTQRRRSPMEREERRDRGSYTPPTRDRELRGNAPMSKAEALANLEKLFRK